MRKNNSNTKGMEEIKPAPMCPKMVAFLEKYDCPLMATQIPPLVAISNSPTLPERKGILPAACWRLLGGGTASPGPLWACSPPAPSRWLPPARSSRKKWLSAWGNLTGQRWGNLKWPSGCPLNGLCTVLDKFQVTPMLFYLVGTRLEDIRCNLVTGETYRPQELIGDEWWVPFDGAWKREIELCLKHFAMRPDFELRDTERGTFEYVGG